MRESRHRLKCQHCGSDVTEGPEDRLTSHEQLLEGMLITLCSSVYGREDYRVDRSPYIKLIPLYAENANYFVMLTHVGCKTSMEYSLNELGVTQRSFVRWVETAVKKVIDIE